MMSERRFSGIFYIIIAMLVEMVVSLRSYGSQMSAKMSGLLFVSKMELLIIVQKFMLVTFGVIVSIIIILIALSQYKNMLNKRGVELDYRDVLSSSEVEYEDDRTLALPMGVERAIESFIGRTRGIE